MTNSTTTTTQTRWTLREIESDRDQAARQITARREALLANIDDEITECDDYTADQRARRNAAIDAAETDLDRVRATFRAAFARLPAAERARYARRQAAERADSDVL